MPEPPLPTPLTHAIGRVVVNGARLELDVVVLVWMSLGHARPVRRPKTGKVKVQSDQFKTSLTDLRSIAQQRLGAPLRGELIRYADRAATSMRARHLVAHGTWSARPDADDRYEVLRLHVTSDGTPTLERYSVAEVDAMADELHEARGALVPLLDRLTVALPEAAPTLHRMPWLTPGPDMARRPYGVAGGALMPAFDRETPQVVDIDHLQGQRPDG